MRKHGRLQSLRARARIRASVTGVAMTLYDEACKVRLRAYVPYSGFHVGAALRTPDGAVFVGCNVENAAYPEGTCAEAGAIAAMVAGGGARIAELVVVADSPQPVPPCGGCRQKIAEFAGPDVQITMANLSGARLTVSVADLLPGAFTPAHMDKG